MIALRRCALLQVFAVSGALERAEARYAWLRKRLKSRASVWALFPPGWRVPQQVALSFCSITRAQLAEALDSKVRGLGRYRLCTPMHAAMGAASLGMLGHMLAQPNAVLLQHHSRPAGRGS